MVRNLLLICLSFSLVLGASGCNQNEDPAASDEQFAAVLAAPVAVGSWLTWQTGLSVVAVYALNQVYIQLTGATQGGVFWDILTISDSESLRRLRSVSKIGPAALASIDSKVPRSHWDVFVTVVMKAVNNPPPPRRGVEVRAEVSLNQSAECKELTAKSSNGVATAGGSCNKPGKTCAAMIRTQDNGPGEPNWIRGVCTCFQKAGEFIWRQCKGLDEVPVASYHTSEWQRVAAPLRFY